MSRRKCVSFQGASLRYATDSAAGVVRRRLKEAEQAKLVGQAVAERAKSKGIEAVVFDRGGFRYVGRIKALADGAREGGLNF